MISMKYDKSNIFTAFLIVGAIFISSLVIYQNFFFERSKLKIVDREVIGWRGIELKGQRKGNVDAPIQIVEFFNYECPYCKEVEPIIQKIYQEFPDKISIVFEHFPLDTNSIAFDAGIVAECAGNQGKFSKMHNLLFSNQEQLDSISFDSLAATARVDNIIEFSKCRNEQITYNVVKSGISLANNLEIGGVPTFLINGKVVPGVVSKESLTDLIETLLSN